jgi:hypothetical protein
MLKSKKVLTNSYTRIQKWDVWLENFDFDVEYKPEYLNFLVHMLTREANQPVLEIMFADKSSRWKAPLTPQELAKKSLKKTQKAIEERGSRKTEFLLVIGEQQQQQLAFTLTIEVIDMHMDKVLIEEIKEWPLKIMILEKWDRTSYFCLN